MRTMMRYPLSIIRYGKGGPAVIRYPLSVICWLFVPRLRFSIAYIRRFIVHSPLSTFHSPLSTFHFPLSIVHCPLSLLRSPLNCLILLVWFLGSSCSNAPDTLGRLDLKKWRSDRGGCQTLRKSLENDFKTVENELLSKHIDEVGHLLGRPDIHQLGSRDQKFYVYFLEKGPHCSDITQKSSAKKVILRFNAVGLLSEISYKTGDL